jgi:hypothetical protein
MKSGRAAQLAQAALQSARQATLAQRAADPTVTNLVRAIESLAHAIEELNR